MKRNAKMAIISAAVVVAVLSFILKDSLYVMFAIAIIILTAVLILVLIKSNPTKYVGRADAKLKLFARRLKKELNTASTVFIMGHKLSDLDSLGGAYGLYYALRDRYNVVLVANKEKTLARPLIDFLRFGDDKCKIHSLEEIDHLVDDNSMLIVVDTHRPLIMDYIELYEKINNVVVIDHHRKSDDFAGKATLNYLHTSASSVCEIVTVLLKLLKVKKLETVAATALLSGIMLDTKNFVMNTGSNTFSAAAYLRRFRADPVLIRKMFSETVEVCKRKYEIVASVSLYENYALARTDTDDSFTRISTAQAADELLTINGVTASFVMCPSDGKINISARSYGDVDVQKIMARLGGGGHKTVAACQINCENFKKAEALLKSAINEYINER